MHSKVAVIVYSHKLFRSTFWEKTQKSLFSLYNRFSVNDDAGILRF